MSYYGCVIHSVNNYFALPRIKCTDEKMNTNTQYEILDINSVLPDGIENMSKKDVYDYLKAKNTAPDFCAIFAVSDEEHAETERQADKYRV